MWQKQQLDTWEANSVKHLCLKPNPAGFAVVETMANSFFIKLINNPTLLQGRICPLSQATAHSVLLKRKMPARNAKNMLQEEFNTQKSKSYYIQIIQEGSLE